MVLANPVEIVRGRDAEPRHARETLLGRSVPHLHQFFRILEGEGLEQHRVYHAEDRGIGPNAKCQYNYCNNSEGGRFAQHPEAEAKILYQGFHNSSHS